MRLSKVLNIRKRIIINRFLSLGIIITAILSVVFGLVTFYGQNAGNFVMSVDAAARQRGILISESDESPFVGVTRLMTDPISDAREVTYSWLKIDEIKQAKGTYIDPDHEYVAFTFFLINTGFEAVDLTYYLRIVGNVHNNLDTGIRVMIIEDGIETIYMKPDDDGVETFYPDDYPPVTHFLTDRLVMRKDILNFRPNRVRPFSVVIWLEGYDPDTTDAILGGMIRMELVFSILMG